METLVTKQVERRFVYDFDEPCEAGRALLGGKGAGLAKMTALGVPVPAGFTITTDACRAFTGAGGDLPAGLDDEVAAHVERLELSSGMRLGDKGRPAPALRLRAMALERRGQR
jgi:pyruvate,orthophosphate dikinase